MFSVFLRTAARDVPGTELSQSEGEELFAHNGYQRISRLYAYGKLRSCFEMTRVVLARIGNQRLPVDVSFQFAIDLGLDHWNGGRQLEVDHQLDSTIQLVEQGRVPGREHLAEERNVFFPQFPNGLIDADPLVNRRFSLRVV